MREETNPAETADDIEEASEDTPEVKWRKKSENRSGNVAAEVQPKDIAQLQHDLDEERRRTADLQDRWHRAAADLSNLRRRTEQEKGEVEKFASMLLVQQMLPVLDNFDRALATIPGNLQMLTWIQGVMLIERHLRAILEQQGLEPIEAQGQVFSAHYHEAIGERETDEAAPGTIVQEYQKGYAMHGRVIRPTLVEVARAKTDGATEEPPKEQREMPSEPVPETTGEVEGEQIAEEAETENVGP